jgi:hypothetical protein
MRGRANVQYEVVKKSAPENRGQRLHHVLAEQVRQPGNGHCALSPGIVEYCDEACGLGAVEGRQLMEQDREFIREIVVVHNEAEEGFISLLGKNPRSKSGPT